MKFCLGCIFALVAFVLSPSLAHCQGAKRSIDDLAWLGGCWQSNVAEKGLLISEQWMKPAGGMMIGAGRTVKSGKTIEYEFIRIVEDAGGIFYVAKPTGSKEETRFKLIKSTTGEIVFENPAHDFPQRILYKREGDKLTARIEGRTNGKERGVNYPYVRVACE